MEVERRGWGMGDGGLLRALAGRRWRRRLDAIKMFLMLVAEKSVDGRGKKEQERQRQRHWQRQRQRQAMRES